MIFLHLSLLAGLGAMGLPVALHLLSRRQPRLVTFPALRFVKHTVVQQRGSWQLRHFLLLLLRVGLIAALALALARPRVHSAMLTTALGLGALISAAIFASLVALIAYVTKRGAAVWISTTILSIFLWCSVIGWTLYSVASGPVVPSSDQTAPVAAAIIVDTGPSLDYRADNSKRLEVAKDMTAWILGQLPIDSRVGVLTNAPLGALSLDPATAKAQVQNLQLQASHVDLLSRLRTAIDLVLASGLDRKEVYVVTDLVRSSWSGNAGDIAKLLEEHSREVLVQIIDVGTQQTTNWQLGNVESETQSLPEGGDAVWSVNVSRSAKTPGASVSVELHQEQIDPTLPIISNGQLKVPGSKIVDRQLVDLTQSLEARINLTARSLQPGTHNFQIRLTVADPLELDNVRYATAVCEAQQSALVVAEDGDVARFLRLALSPFSDGEKDPTESSTTQQVRYNQLPEVAMDRYAVLVLNDPPTLPPSTITLLESHVKQGGGLFITLGPAIGSPEDAQASPLSKLLPGKLARVTRRATSDNSLFLVNATETHPLFHIFGAMVSDVPWNVYPIYRSWELENLAADAQILMTTSDRALPALIMQPRGAGQILTLTTPLPARLESGQVQWNALISGENPWPAFGLLNGAVRVLSGQTQSRYNFMAGQPVTLSNDTKTFPALYELYSPAGQTRRVQANEGMLLLGSLDQAGTYRLRALQGSNVRRAASVNTPADDTKLVRMETAELDALLGQGHYKLAREKREIESSVGQARYGRELFPLLMVCVAGLFLAEQAMSNRFYRLRLSGAKARP